MKPDDKRFISIRTVFGMAYVICVTEKCNYARHLFLTIVMTMKFFTCINGHAGAYNIKCVVAF